MTKTKYWLSILAISVVLIAGSLAVIPIVIADDDDGDDDDETRISDLESVEIYTKTKIVEFEDEEVINEELRCDPGDKVITGYFKNIGDTRISYSSHTNSAVFEESGEEVWLWNGQASSGAMTVEFTIFCAKP